MYTKKSISKIFKSYILLIIRLTTQLFISSLEFAPKKKKTLQAVHILPLNILCKPVLLSEGDL